MKRVISAASGFLLGAAADRYLTVKKYNGILEQERQRGDKLLEFYNLLLLWLELRQRGGTVKSFFDKNGYQSAAVYGMKELGEALCFELDSVGIDVKYLIDKNADSIYSSKPVYLPEDLLPDVDVIVVTALHYYEEIERELSVNVNCPVLNLADIIYEALTCEIEGSF